MIHLLYERLDGRSINRFDPLVADLGTVVVGWTRVSNETTVFKINNHSIFGPGFFYLYFTFIGKCYDVLKFYSPDCEFTGYYVDFTTPARRKELTLLQTDLFLDLWIYPNRKKWLLLDLKEFQNARNEGVISEYLVGLVTQTYHKILPLLRVGSFPPALVDYFTVFSSKNSKIAE